jgi:hypothetical protein
MKKTLFILIGICLLSLPLQAQWKVGGNFASASGGSATDAYNISFGVDAYYMFRNPDAFFKYGFNASLLFIPGQEVDVLGSPVKFENANFLPASFAVRFTFFRVLTLGPDVGYGLSLNSEIPGGLYIKGILGLDIANAVEVHLFLSNVNAGENNNFTSGGIGFLIHIY